MNLEFLNKTDKKIVRTRLYGDQEFSPTRRGTRTVLSAFVDSSV